MNSKTKRSAKPYLSITTRAEFFDLKHFSLITVNSDKYTNQKIDNNNNCQKQKQNHRDAGGKRYKFDRLRTRSTVNVYTDNY